MRHCVLLPFVLLLGCGAEPPPLDPSSKRRDSLLIESYDRQLAYRSPVACELFLYRRVVSQADHAVEYDVRVGDRDLAIVYSVDPGAELPLVTTVYDVSGEAGEVLVTTRADQKRLQLERGTEVVAEVRDYVSEGASAVLARSGWSLDPAALTGLACALPIRTALGSVPGFLLNRTDAVRSPDEPNVARHSPDRQPLLRGWTAPVSVLGAFVMASTCLEPSPSVWSCPCFGDLAPTLVGEVPLRCGRPLRDAPIPALLAP